MHSSRGKIPAPFCKRSGHAEMILRMVAQPRGVIADGRSNFIVQNAFEQAILWNKFTFASLTEVDLSKQLSAASVSSR